VPETSVPIKQELQLNILVNGSSSELITTFRRPSKACLSKVGTGFGRHVQNKELVLKKNPT